MDNINDSFGLINIDCCKTTIPSDLDAIRTIIVFTDRAPFESSKDCKYASLVDQKWFGKNLKTHFKVRKMSHLWYYIGQ